jgi:hypothetical protein
MQFDAPVNSTDGALVLFFTSRRNNTMRLLQYPARHSFIGERETLRAVFPVRLRIRNKKIAFGDLKEREGERKRHGINYPTSLPCLALPCLALPCLALPPLPLPLPSRAACIDNSPQTARSRARSRGADNFPFAGREN